jgi:hypothetical protein|tara:strand:+ start:2252 stop:2422 length:171 start_codon:yes stop_codon:yes gene_type:complete
MGTNFSNQTTDSVIQLYEFRIQALTSKLRRIKEIIDTDGDELSDGEAIDEIYKIYE